MRITCDNPYHDAGDGYCIFCHNQKLQEKLRQVTDLEALCRRIVADRACICNVPDHRCGTNLMLEDLERIILRPVVGEKRNSETVCWVCGEEATGKIGAEPRCERHV